MAMEALVTITLLEGQQIVEARKATVSLPKEVAECSVENRNEWIMSNALARLASVDIPGQGRTSNRPFIESVVKKGEAKDA
jgi:hypothetical protein